MKRSCISVTQGAKASIKWFKISNMLKMKGTVSVTLNYKGSVYTFPLNSREIDECRQSKIQNTTSYGKSIKKVDQKNEIASKVSTSKPECYLGFVAQAQYLRRGE